MNELIIYNKVTELLDDLYKLNAYHNDCVDQLNEGVACDRKKVGKEILKYEKQIVEIENDITTFLKTNGISFVDLIRLLANFNAFEKYKHLLIDIKYIINNSKEEKCIAR